MNVLITQHTYNECADYTTHIQNQASMYTYLSENKHLFSTSGSNALALMNLLLYWTVCYNGDIINLPWSAKFGDVPDIKLPLWNHQGVMQDSRLKQVLTPHIIGYWASCCLLFSQHSTSQINHLPCQILQVFWGYMIRWWELPSVYARFGFLHSTAVPMWFFSRWSWAS